MRQRPLFVAISNSEASFSFYLLVGSTLNSGNVGVVLSVGVDVVERSTFFTFRVLASNVLLQITSFFPHIFLYHLKFAIPNVEAK